MDITTAKEIIARYTKAVYTAPSGETKGFYTPKDVAEMPRKNFEEEVQIWAVEYIEAVLTLATAWNFDEQFDLQKHGKTDITEWGYRAKKMREIVEFKKSTEGKKHLLRTIVSVPCRTEEKDREEMMKDSSVQVASAGTGRGAEKQTKLNVQRMEHLKALEKSISKGGALREVYERTLQDYHRKVEELPTNEEALALSERDQKELRPKALWVASLVMPLFVFVRTVDIILDSFILGKMQGGFIETKLGGEYMILSRTFGNSLIAAFIALVLAFCEVGTTGVVALFFENFFCLFILFAIARNLIGIITELLTIFIGKVIVVPASKCFEAASQNDYQMFDVSREMEYLKEFESQIKEREDIIEDLRTIINEDQPYGYVDEFLKGRKDLSLKRLAQDAADNEIIKKQLAAKSVNQE